MATLKLAITPDKVAKDGTHKIMYEFTKGEFLLSEITPEIISNYDRFLRNKKGIGETTISMMMSRTRTIINRGIKKQLVKYDVLPFAYYSIKASPVREVDITVENLIKIKTAISTRRSYV